MKIFFDLDPAVYMSAFAAQKAYYTVYWEDTDGKVHETYCSDGVRKKEFLIELDQAEAVVLDAERIIEAKDVSFARQCAKTTLEGAIRTIRREYPHIKLEPYYYLTGASNFRDEIATIAEYKGNRKEMEKPVHYQAVRDYFIHAWDAEVIEGMEADDEVSIRGWEEWKDNKDCIIATIDKDLDQIPGLHYDYKKHVFYEVDELEAEMFFYAQILSGDVTDNIKGCYRVGVGKAARAIGEWFEEYCGANSQQSFEAWVWPKIVAAYEANYEAFPQFRPEGLTAEEAALENARLVYLLREEGESWTPAKS